MQQVNFPGCLKASAVGLTKAKTWRVIMSVLHWIFQIQYHDVQLQALRLLIIVLLERYSIVSNVISQLLWFCFASLCNWPAKHVPPSLKNQNQSCPARTRFPSFGVVYIYLCSMFDCFIVLFASVVIGQSNYFGFGFSTLIWKPL